MEKNIILIGMTGVGKTTIGKEISKILNYKFIDLDLNIEENNDNTIENIFKNYGEDFFRKEESSELLKVLDEKKSVISTGAGIVEKKENLEILKKIGIIIFLDSDMENLEKNIINDIDNIRPLLNKENLTESLNIMYNNRYNKYYEISDIIVKINNTNINEIALDIIKKINENHSCS